MAFGKRNQVSLNILDYNIMLLGESGAGKTSVINEVCTKYTGNPDSVLFLEMGNERGADALQNINYINCPDYDSEYDEFSNSAGFMTVCEDIIENKATEYPDLKVVVIDTLDQWIDTSEKCMLDNFNRECKKAGHPEKCVTSINACYGGFGRPEKKTIEMMQDVLSQLKRVGVSTIIIGHCKKKDVTDVFTGETYQVLTSDQQQNYFNAFKKNMHFIGLLYIDRTIQKEKTGKKGFDGKDKVVGTVTGEARRIKFRDNGAVVDCKSRFSDIVEEIPLDADQFIKALEDAIKAEQSKSGKSYEATKAEQEAATEAHMEKVAAAEASNKAQKEIDTVVAEIITFMKDNRTTKPDALKAIMALCKENGVSNPQNITDMDLAQQVLALCK